MLIVVKTQVVNGTHPELSRLHERVCYQNRRLTSCSGSCANSKIKNRRQEDLYACVVSKQVSEGSQEKI